ncbi:MAG: cysteine desulfurase/selenocysteine lyase [Rhodothermales bacterium]|jgi:cysteine desulfurase/selenocysteine lyase
MTLRDRFPALARTTYLNTAGGAPIPDVAHHAAAEYYRESLEDGDVHWNEWIARTNAARGETGGLVGCPSEHMAFVGNASVGLNLVASLYPGDRFAYPETEFPSCTLPWLRRGFQPSAWKVRADGGFDADDVRAAAAGVDVVVLSWVQFSTGFRADLVSIAEVCRNAGARLVVDATQGVAAFPLDATALRLDAVVFSGYKWLTSGYGVAGLALPKGLPAKGSPNAGWRSQREPFALEAGVLDPGLDGSFAEAGHPPFPGSFAMGAAAKLWGQEEPARTADRIRSLMLALHECVDRLGLELLSTRDQDHLSGIALIKVGDPSEIATALKERGIQTSARGSGLRVSVHAYNSAADLDGFETAMREILGRT